MNGTPYQLVGMFVYLSQGKGEHGRAFGSRHVRAEEFTIAC